MSVSVEERFAEIERRLRLLEDGIGGSGPAERPSAGRTTSPREFLLQKAPHTDNDKALAAGYYIEILSGKESFDLDDLGEFYRKAKEAGPRNRSLPPFLNVKNGFFREAEKRQVGGKVRNSWALTNSGIARVESGFGDGGGQ